MVKSICQKYEAWFAVGADYYIVETVPAGLAAAVFGRVKLIGYGVDWMASRQTAQELRAVYYAEPTPAPIAATEAPTESPRRGIAVLANVKSWFFVSRIAQCAGSGEKDYAASASTSAYSSSRASKASMASWKRFSNSASGIIPASLAFSPSK